MARTQAEDYEQRREAILDQAAKLYAAKGFLGASISDLAEACKMSKSLIYHYYCSKQEILFDLMHSHVESLLDIARAVSAQNLEPRAKLEELGRKFMRLYGGAAPRHRVLLNDLHQLPARRRKIIVNIQRQIVDLVEDILADIRPKKTLPEAARWPVAMFFFGMINWTHIWLNPHGPLGLEEIADLMSELFLNGIEKAKMPGD
jgi:AcrR family transcriptional regulator